MTTGTRRSRHERGSGTGRHAQGRVHADLGRCTPGLAGRRPALPGLGGLPRRRLPGRPRPALRLAVQRLVRPGDPALRRRRPHLGARSATTSPTRACPAPPVVRRHAAPVGVHPGLAPRAVTDRSRHRLRRRRRTPRCSARPTAARRWQELPRPARARLRAAVAARRGRHVPAHDRARPERRQQRMYGRDLGRRRVPHRRRRRHVAADQQGPALRRHPLAGGRGRALRAQPRDAPVATRHALHAEALGRHAYRRRRRELDRDQRQPAERLRLPHRGARARAGDRLRRADHQRLAPLPARGQAARLPQPQRRQRVGGADRRPAAGELLRQRAARRDGRRRPCDECGLYFGTTGGQVYALGRLRRHLGTDRARPAGGALGRGADDPHDRGASRLPAHLRQLAQCAKQVEVDVDASTQRGSARRARARATPHCAGRCATRRTGQRRRVRPVLRLRGGPLARAARRAAARAGGRGREPFLVVGAMAGG